ncbi:MAG: NfeD family protein [Oscillospiraceae bacterium]|nr:NfeD family protein [Oscillospiraceae bacterium]
MEWMAAVWFGLLVLFLWMEASTVTMISTWFALGALAAMIASFCGGELWLQIVLFFVVSTVFLLSLRPLAKKFFTPKIVKTNVDSVIGSRGKVLEEIDNITAKGRVKLGGMEWSARSTGGENIAADTLVTVDKVEGVKVFVTPVK